MTHTPFGSTAQGTDSFLSRLFVEAPSSSLISVSTLELRRFVLLSSPGPTIMLAVDGIDSDTTSVQEKEMESYGFKSINCYNTPFGCTEEGTDSLLSRVFVQDSR